MARRRRVALQPLAEQRQRLRLLQDAGVALAEAVQAPRLALRARVQLAAQRDDAVAGPISIAVDMNDAETPGTDSTQS